MRRAPRLVCPVDGRQTRQPARRAGGRARDARRARGRGRRGTVRRGRGRGPRGHRQEPRCSPSCAQPAAARAACSVLAARGGELEREFPFGVVRQLFEPRLADRGGARALAGRARPPPPRPVFEPAEPGRGDGRRRRPSPSLHGLYWLTAQPRRRAAAAAGRRRPALVRPPVAALPRLPRAPARGPAGRCSRSALRTRRAGHRPGAGRRARRRPARRCGAPRPAERRGRGASSSARGSAPSPTPPSPRPATRRPAATRCCCASCSARSRPRACAPDAAHGARSCARSGRAPCRARVLLRLARLPREAAAVARAVAVLGDGAELPLVAALAGLDEPARRRGDRGAGAGGDPARRAAARLRAPARARRRLPRRCPPGERELRHAARRACCTTPARRPRRSPPSCSRRPAAARSGWWTCSRGRGAPRRAAGRRRQRRRLPPARARRAAAAREPATPGCSSSGSPRRPSRRPAAAEHLRAGLRGARATPAPRPRPSR